MIRRREFITLLGAAAAAWPVGAKAQAKLVIGVLDSRARVAAIEDRLRSSEMS